MAKSSDANKETLPEFQKFLLERKHSAVKLFPLKSCQNEEDIVREVIRLCYNLSWAGNGQTI